MFNSTGNFKAMGQYGQMYKNTSVATFADARQLEKFVNAIKEEDIKSMRKIMKKGIDVNLELRFEMGMEKMTALHFSAVKGLVLAAHELLAAKCDFNKGTQFDLSTPLHFACQLDDVSISVPIVKDLLTHGANPNLLDHSGRTPLYIAVLRESLEVTRLLLRYGADAGIICKEDECPEAIQRMSKHLELGESELQEMYDPFQGNSPLIQACREHYVDIVRELLKSDCDVNYCNSAGNTALHVAAKSESRTTHLEDKISRFPLSGSVEVVELLISAGAALDCTNLQEDTALKRAADGVWEIFTWPFPTEDKIRYAQVFCDVTSCLVLSGCNVSTRYGEKTILTVLLQAAGNVRQADSLALANKYVVCIMHLLAAGAMMSSADLDEIQRLDSTVSMLPTFLIEASERPSTLKHLCKLTLRCYMRHPLRRNINTLGLPRSLKGYVNLETNL